MDNKIQQLINERIHISNLTRDLNLEISKLRHRLNNINRELLETCPHKWNIDNSYMDEHTVYQCTICKCYPDYDVKMSNIPP